VESALSATSRAGKGMQGFRVGIEFVLMRDNVRELPEVLRWAGRRGVAFVLVTQLMLYNKLLVPQAAYAQIQLRLLLFSVIRRIVQRGKGLERSTNHAFRQNVRPL
jgi:hypothetical protein